jgi:hypothetical protein
MSVLTEKKLKSSQVAAILEDHIAKGKFEPGERLKSTRALANDFGVGQRVIISALDILEWKKLVKRKERYGVYVCHPSRKPDIKEVMIFAFGGTPADNNFIQVISEFIHVPTVREKYDFFVRFIPGEDANLRIDVELERMEKFGYPDCVLIVGLQFRRPEIEKSLKLSYPVLFLGNFIENDYPDLKYNRIGGDNFSPLKACLEYAVKNNRKNVMLIDNNDYSVHSDFRRVRHQAEIFAEECKLNFKYLPVPGKADELPEAFATALEQKKIAGKLPELLILDSAEPLGFQRRISAKGIHYPEDLDVISLVYAGKQVPPFKYIDRNFNLYYREMVKAIDIICSGGDAQYGIKDINVMNSIKGG